MKFYTLLEIVDNENTRALTAGASSSCTMSGKPGSGIRKIFLVWNSESLVLESGIQLKRYNPNFTNKDRNQVHGIRNLGRGIQNQRLSFTWGKSSLSVFSNTVRKKKERKEKDSKYWCCGCCIFFCVQGKLFWVIWKRTINELHKQLVSRLLLRRVL